MFGRPFRGRGKGGLDQDEKVGERSVRGNGDLSLRGKEDGLEATQGKRSIGIAERRVATNFTGKIISKQEIEL